MVTRATSRAAYDAIRNARDSSGRSLLMRRQNQVYEFICLNWHRYVTGITRQDVHAHFNDIKDGFKPRIAELAYLRVIHCVGTRLSTSNQPNDCWRPYGRSEIDIERAFVLRRQKEWRKAQKRLDRLLDEIDLWAIPEISDPAARRRLREVIQRAKNGSPDTPAIVAAREARRLLIHPPPPEEDTGI